MTESLSSLRCRTSSDLRFAVVAAARAWLGTPYHHAADIRGVGVDCAMILVRVFCDLGLVPSLRSAPVHERLDAAPRRRKLSRLPAAARAREVAQSRARRRDAVSRRPMLFARGNRDQRQSADDRSRFRAAAALSRRKSPATPQLCEAPREGEFFSFWARPAPRSPPPSSDPLTMAALVRSRRNRRSSRTIPALQLQTAVSTLPIPIFYGQTKVAPNIIFYANFQTVRGQQRRQGRLVRQLDDGRYNYTADLIMALCEGPISGDRPHLARPIDLHARAARSDAVRRHDAASGLGLSCDELSRTKRLPIREQPTSARRITSSATAADIGNHNFEIIGVLAGTGVNGIDADPAQVIYDFLTNAQYGAGFNPASINLTTLYGAGGDASLADLLQGHGHRLLARCFRARSRPRRR